MSKQNSNDSQKKYLELQIIIQQINQIQEQISNLNNQVVELNELKKGINLIKDVKNNTESFVPVGFNIFAKAKLENANELLVNVGSNIFVMKNIEETIFLINSQIEQIEIIIKEIDNKLYRLEHAGELIQSEILSANK
jgi:prefoldin alpha subunit